MKSLKLPNGENIYYIDRFTANHAYNEIFVDNEYLKHGINVKEGDIVFDVGANIGLFSLFIAKKVPNLRIYAFEPIPKIFQILKANLSKLNGNITTFNIGLGDANKNVEFYFYPNFCVDSTAIPFDFNLKVDLYLKNYEDVVCKYFPLAGFVPIFLRKSVIKLKLKDLYKSEKISCQIKTLSEIIKENNINKIDLLKLDAENYEKQVLNGLKDNDWDKIKQISMEIHEHIKGGENLLNDITELLENKGFKTQVGDNNLLTKLRIYMLYAKKA